MPAPNPWTAADDQRLTVLHGEGRSLHSIAAEMTRSKHTISRKAAALGLTWDRTATAKAAEAVVVDNRKRRGAIVTRLYAQAEAELAGLEQASQGWRTILKGEYGLESGVTLTFAPSRDRRDVADILSRHLTAAAKLEAIDASAGVDTERSLLAQLGQALGVTGPDQ